MANEILADVTVGNTTATIAVLTLVFGWLTSTTTAILKYLRDQRADKANLTVLKSIDDNNLALVRGQEKQNGKLETVVQVNKAYHDQLIGISSFQFEQISKKLDSLHHDE